MEITLRQLQKVRKVGNSLILTLPKTSMDEMGIEQGDQLVIYQLREALVIVPFLPLTKRGAPPSLQEVDRLTRRLAP